MLTTVKGYYEKGQVFLTELPPVSEKTEVIVTFLPSSEEAKEEVPKKRQLGLLEGKIKMSDDFDEPLEEMKEYM